MVEKDGFQAQCKNLTVEVFGEAAAADTTERVHRFTEEALELGQALGCTREEAHQLVNYVYGRPVGEPGQEVGGVMTTLASGAYVLSTGGVVARLRCGAAGNATCAAAPLRAGQAAGAGSAAARVLRLRRWRQRRAARCGARP